LLLQGLQDPEGQEVLMEVDNKRLAWKVCKGSYSCVAAYRQEKEEPNEL
jgi:hypothetical protein